MSKKKQEEQKITKKVNNTEEVIADENTEKSEKEEVKEEVIPPTTEELLATEKDKNLRLFAEFENFRKRTNKERIELFTTANKDIMSALLPILDNFERLRQSFQTLTHLESRGEKRPKNYETHKHSKETH